MRGGPFQFLRTKVALALIGTCLIGGVSAILAAQITLSQEAALIAANAPLSNVNTTNSGPTSTGSGTSGATATGSATATATDSGGGGGGGGHTSPTNTPFIFPTRTPRPIPTATNTPSAGQPCNWNGQISAVPPSVPANTFTLHFSGVGHTIDVVNGSTQFTGSATTFAGLQVGWQASVSGTVQNDGSCQAATVNSSLDT